MFFSLSLDNKKNNTQSLFNLTHAHAQASGGENTEPTGFLKVYPDCTYDFVVEAGGSVTLYGITFGSDDTEVHVKFTKTGWALDCQTGGKSVSCTDKYCE